MIKKEIKGKKIKKEIVVKNECNGEKITYHTRNRSNKIPNNNSVKEIKKEVIKKNKSTKLNNIKSEADDKIVNKKPEKAKSVWQY